MKTQPACRLTRANSFEYTAFASPSRGVGCESPMEFAAKSRNRKVRGFFVGAPVLAALMGGLRSCRFSLREFPGLSHPSALPPDVRVGRQSFHSELLEPNMADLFSGASAQITPFNFNSHAVRVIQRDGTPWFVAGDVCDALGYEHVPHAMRLLDDDEKGVQKADTLGGKQQLTIINESGLYALVLRSRKPEARKFAKWVTSEVLPAIRKTGAYSAPNAATAPTPVPSLLNRRWLISYDDTGREQVKRIDDDAMIVTASNLPERIRDSYTLTGSDLERIIAACTERLVSQASAARESIAILRERIKSLEAK